MQKGLFVSWFLTPRIARDIVRFKESIRLDIIMEMADFFKEKPIHQQISDKTDRITGALYLFILL